MAKSNAVWGIDIGQCALKALRCRPHDKEEKRMVVEAFDYIEYPKILTQPEANRDELTTQELQVARVVAGGATNKQAAAALFLSTKTIEFHLARVYRKLGVRTRTELATLAVRRGWL